MDLNLLEYKDELKLQEENGQTKVFDPVRKKYIVFKGEEMVRQLIIRYLINKIGISRTSIAVEKMLVVNKLEKRFDLLIFDTNAKPWMIIECKSPDIQLSQRVIDQAAMYNSMLHAPFLLVSNGIHSRIFQLDFEKSNWQECNLFPK